MGLPMGQKLVKSGSTWTILCGTHISEATGWIYTIRSSMELCRPVVVQHHGHLTLTLDFQGQILKMLYIRNGIPSWHGTKGMWVDRIVTFKRDLTHELDPRFSRSSFEKGVTQELDARLTWNEGMWVDRMLDPHYDFELWPHPWPWPLIFKVKFWKSRNSGMGCPIDMERKGCESTECWTHVVTFNFDLTCDLDLEFSTSNF